MSYGTSLHLNVYLINGIWNKWSNDARKLTIFKIYFEAPVWGKNGSLKVAKKWTWQLTSVCRMEIIFTCEYNCKGQNR